MEKVTIRQGRLLCERLPPLILGTATFNTQYVSDPLQMPYRRIVSRALELGVTAFDTSPYYGPSEILLGDALAAAQEAGVARESYAIITKAGRIAPREFDYSPAHIRSSILRSLERLHTPYLDLVYLHDVEFVSSLEVLEAVRELRRLPQVRAVGISGFPVPVLCDLAEMVLRETGVPLDAVLSYGHFTVQNCSLARSEVMGVADDGASPVRRLKAAGVDVVLNASMLNMGLLTSTGIPPDPETESGSPLAKWHPSPPALRVACKTLAEKAAAAGERLEAVAIRWSLYEWARVGALAGVGIQLPGMQGATVGGSVMGVTSVDELEETVREWEGVLASLDFPNNKSAPSASKDKIESTSKLVRDVLWPALGEWQDYSWASPELGFVSERAVQRSSI
ncbi:D-arabinose 1-dehydrogenase [Apiospora rasikravindrae]|uniref:D-arabinose 1-dehydrogenase n=1 Tax=Apiospora rasikravindrae TaxID=990691 RepID=A0ABR1S1R3_9PEZI